MQKILIITIICIVILSISVVRIFQIFCTIYFYYDYVIWCNKNDKEYIKSKSGIDTNFNIAVCKVSWNREKQQSQIVRKFPTILTETTDIKNNNYDISEYIRSNDGKGEVILKSSIIYIILAVCSMIMLYKKVILEQARM